MVMLRGPPQYIASAITSGMYLTDKSNLGKYLQSAIDGDQPDAGVFLMHHLIYSGRGKTALAMDKDI